MRIVAGAHVVSIKYEPSWIKTIKQGNSFVVEETLKTAIQYTLFASVPNENDVLDRTLLQFFSGAWRCLKCPRTEGCVHVRQWDTLCRSSSGIIDYIDHTYFQESTGIIYIICVF